MATETVRVNLRVGPSDGPALWSQPTDKQLVRVNNVEANRRASWGGTAVPCAVPDTAKAPAFHAVHGAATTNLELYTAAGVKHLVQRFMQQRESAVLLTFGHSGSGKTFTMMGGPGDGNGEGMVALAIRDLFPAAAAEGARLELQAMEVYQDAVIDCLAGLASPAKGPPARKLLELRAVPQPPAGSSSSSTSGDSSSSSGGGGSEEFRPSGVTSKVLLPEPKLCATTLAATCRAAAASSCEEQVPEEEGEKEDAGLLMARHVQDAISLTRAVQAQRQTGATAHNLTSSRSHLIFRFIVTAVRSVAYLDICDLAGMESLKQPAAAATTGVTGAEGAATTPRRSQRLSLPGGGGFGGSGSARGGSGSAAKPSLAGECCSIQQDLAALKRVVGSKAEGAAHIPYRDSTLTKLLQPSLSGGSRVLLIATVKPSQDGPTRATLDFAADCAKLQPQPVRRLLPPPVPVEPVVAVAEAAYLAAVAEAAAVAAASAADTTGAAGTPTRPLRQPKRPHTPGSLWRPPLSIHRSAAPPVTAGKPPRAPSGSSTAAGVRPQPSGTAAGGWPPPSPSLMDVRHASPLTLSRRGDERWAEVEKGKRCRLSACAEVRTLGAGPQGGILQGEEEAEEVEVKDLAAAGQGDGDGGRHRRSSRGSGWLDLLHHQAATSAAAATVLMATSATSPVMLDGTVAVEPMEVEGAGAAEPRQPSEATSTGAGSSPAACGSPRSPPLQDAVSGGTGLLLPPSATAAAAVLNMHVEVDSVSSGSQQQDLEFLGHENGCQRQQLEAMTRECMQLQARLGRVEQHCQKLQEQAEASKAAAAAKIAVLQQQLKDTQEQAVASKAAAAEAAVAALHQQLASDNARARDIAQAQLAAAREEAARAALAAQDHHTTAKRAQAEAEQLQATITGLRQELVEAAVKAEAVSSAAAVTRQQAEALQDQLRQQAALLTVRDTELAAAQAQVGVLQQRLEALAPDAMHKAEDAAAARVAAVQRKAEEERQRLQGQWEADLTKERQATAEAQQRLEDSEVAAAGLQAKWQAQAKQLEDLEEERDQLHSRAEAVVAQLEALREAAAEAAEAAESQKAALADKLFAAEAEAAALQQQLLAVAQERDQLQARLDLAKHEFAASQPQRAAAEHDRDALAGQLRDSEAKAAEMAAALEARAAAAEDQVAQLEQAKEELRTQWAGEKERLLNNLQAAAASDMQMQLKLKRLEREKNDLARQVATRTEQLEEQERMMLAQRLAGTAGGAADGHELLTLQAQVADLKKQLTAAAAAAAETAERHAASLAALQKQLAEAKHAEKEAQEAKDELAARRRQLEEQAAQLTQRQAALAAQLEEAERAVQQERAAAVEAAKAAEAKARQKLEDLQKQLKQQEKQLKQQKNMLEEQEKHKQELSKALEVATQERDALRLLRDEAMRAWSGACSIVGGQQAPLTLQPQELLPQQHPAEARGVFGGQQPSRRKTMAAPAAVPQLTLLPHVPDENEVPRRQSARRKTMLPAAVEQKRHALADVRQPPPAVPAVLAAGITRQALLSTTGVAVAAAQAPFLKPAVKPTPLPVPPAAGGGADAARAAGGHGGRRATLLGHEQQSGEAAQRQPLEEPQQEEEAFEVVDSDEEDEDEEADRSYEPRSDSGRQRKKQRVNTGGARKRLELQPFPEGSYEIVQDGPLKWKVCRTCKGSYNVKALRHRCDPPSTGALPREPTAMQVWLAEMRVNEPTLR